MNFEIYLCVTLRLFSLSFVLLLAPLLTRPTLLYRFSRIQRARKLHQRCAPASRRFSSYVHYSAVGHVVVQVPVVLAQHDISLTGNRRRRRQDVRPSVLPLSCRRILVRFHAPLIGRAHSTAVVGRWRTASKVSRPVSCAADRRAVNPSHWGCGTCLSIQVAL